MRQRGALLLLAALLTGVAIAQSPGEQFRRGLQADLKKTLEAELEARRPEEFAYLARVVKMVDEGKLPESLVKSTFAWARRKRPYPLMYFERALRIRALKIGITVQGIESPSVFQ